MGFPAALRIDRRPRPFAGLTGEFSVILSPCHSGGGRNLFNNTRDRQRKTETIGAERFASWRLCDSGPKARTLHVNREDAKGGMDPRLRGDAREGGAGGFAALRFRAAGAKSLFESRRREACRVCRSTSATITAFPRRRESIYEKTPEIDREKQRPLARNALRLCDTRPQGDGFM